MTIKKCNKPIRRFLWCGNRDKKQGGLGIGSLMSKKQGSVI